MDQNKTINHQCPFCKQAFVFYKIKESERYIWYSCANCGFKRRVKNTKPKQIKLFAGRF